MLYLSSMVTTLLNFRKTRKTRTTQSLCLENPGKLLKTQTTQSLCPENSGKPKQPKVYARKTPVFRSIPGFPEFFGFSGVFRIVFRVFRNQEGVVAKNHTYACECIRFVMLCVCNPPKPISMPLGGSGER